MRIFTVVFMFYKKDKSVILLFALGISFHLSFRY